MQELGDLFDTIMTYHQLLEIVVPDEFTTLEAALNDISPGQTVCPRFDPPTFQAFRARYKRTDLQVMLVWSIDWYSSSGTDAKRCSRSAGDNK